jgi:nucleolar protein 53
MEGLVSDFGKETKKKKGARNSKQYQRKVDVTDVEEHAESLRHDERSGGALSERADADLFMVDGAGSAAPAVDVPMGRKARARAKVLYNDKALEANPHVKPHGNRAGASTVDKYNDTRHSKRRRIDRIAAAAGTAAPARMLLTAGGFEEDTTETDVIQPQGKEVWDTPAPEPTVLDLNPWLGPEKVRIKAIKAPSRFGGKEKSVIPAVTVVAGGASYNPSFENHQRLLRSALTTEEKVVKEKQVLWEKTSRERLSGREKDILVFQELSVGFADDTDEEDAAAAAIEDALDGPLQVSLNPATTADRRKTKQQRKKALQQKEREQKSREKKALRAQQAEVFRLKSLIKELKNEKDQSRLKQAEKELLAQEGLKIPRRLGPNKFRERPAALKLTEELVGSLRALKPEANLFQDRFESMQKRNMIQVTVPVKMKRRYKLKEYEKRSYKNYDLNRELKAKEKERLIEVYKKQEERKQLNEQMQLGKLKAASKKP